MLGIFVVAGVAGAFLRPNRYEASATIIGVPPNGRADFNSVQAVQFLLPTVVKDVSTVTFRNLVRRSLPAGSVPVRRDDRCHARARDGHPPVDGTKQEPRRRRPGRERGGARSRQSATDAEPRAEDARPAHRARSTSAKLRGPDPVSSIALGLIFAVFAALIRDALDRRLRSAEDIYEQLGLEILGEIPAFESFPPPLRRCSRARRTRDSPSRISDSSRTSRSPWPGKDIRTIAITSAASNEGKTTVTTCLAWALAQLGHNVVAIDGDLRKPTLAKRLEVNGGTGLANAQNGNLAQIERKTRLPSLTVIPAGHGTLHPAQVVNHELPQVLRAVSDRLVLIDTPPVLAAAEAMLIAMMAKHVIVVIDRKSPAYRTSSASCMSCGERTQRCSVSS